MEDSRYLDTINELANTVKALAIEKNKKVNDYKTIFIVFIIALTLVTSMFAGCIVYGIHSIYGYPYTITNENTNTNTNVNRGDK
jgi:hypothetical protein